MGLLDSTMSFLGGDDLLNDITGSEDAANAMLTANEQSIAALTDMFNTSVELQEPFREIGLESLQQLQGEVNQLTPESRLAAIQNAFQTSPGFQNRLRLGLDQVEGSAAARGSLFSGNTLKGLEDYRQNLAANEYNNFFNQYSGIADNRLNRLAAMGGVGQTATNNLTNLNTMQGQNLSNMFMNQGNINAGLSMAPFNSLLSIANVAGQFAG